MSYDHPFVRAALAPEIQDIPDEQLDALVRGRLALPVDDAEDFLQDLARVGSNALPGVISGAASGAALGPWGALAGGLIGGATSALGSKPGAPRPAGAGAPAAASTPAAATPATPALPQGAGAASQLLGLLARPEVLRALTALALGDTGAPTVQVGAKDVPAGAVANMVSVLGAQAAKAHPTPDAGAARPNGQAESLAEYLLDDDGRPRVDPFSSQERAAALFELFLETPLAAPGFEESWIHDEEAWDGGSLYESQLEED